MNPDTGELKMFDELRELYGSNQKISEAGFVPVPEALEPAALALINFRDDQRKLKARRRNQIAKESRRKNRGGA